jgi:2-phosphosulfolactate phosphatase
VELRAYHPRMPREVNVHLLPRHFEPDELRGGIAVVIDVLRASTTIVTALANGARRIVPCGDVDMAKRVSAGFAPGEALLGGERGGVRIAGFDLDNSPAAYTSDRVAGKTIVFTTTNGTAALLRAQQADRVLIGSLVNRQALVREIAGDDRAVHLVCAGTVGIVTAEDVLAAGAIAAELECGAGTSSRDDLALVAKEYWAAASSSSERLQSVLRQSRGGRNLVELGFHSDIDFAARVDSIPLVAEYFAKTADVRTVR